MSAILNKTQAETAFNIIHTNQSRLFLNLDVILIKNSSTVDNRAQFSEQLLHFVRKTDILFEITPDLYGILLLGSHETEAIALCKLKEGNRNPEAANYNSMTDYHWTDTMLEIRIPWLLLQARDPSQRELVGNLQKDGLEASIKVDEIYIGAVQYNANGQIVQSSVPITNDVLQPLTPYTWPTWDLPASKERLKQSYYILQELFKDY